MTHRVGKIKLVAAATFACTVAGAGAAQTAYRHRDANGQWVFTDQAASAAATGDSFHIGMDPGNLHIAIERHETATVTELTAVNDCLCAVTFELAILDSSVAGITANARYDLQLEPHTRQTVLQAPRSPGTAFHYKWDAALGSAAARHEPARPYRAPFAVGASFPVSQAYPSQVTHNTPESAYAVDIVLPDGTPVYSAREGTVVNVRHDSFRGFLAPVMLDQANLVAILHPDGTIAIYAHLHWDSIRVRIGDRIVRGQYIANSGNTGFSSGPHLHFAVLRNSGHVDVSVPVQFAGPGQSALEPVTGMALTAY